jgi:hypothetical protein
MNPKPALVSFLFIAIACCGPRDASFLEEDPVGSGEWADVPAEPSWVKAPPAAAGCIRVVLDSRSNLRDVAVTGLDHGAAKRIADRVRMALRTQVTSPAAEAAAAAVEASMRRVRRACRHEVLTREPVPGNTLATVWGLYEVSIADLVNAVDEPQRATARAALEKL